MSFPYYTEFGVHYPKYIPPKDPSERLVDPKKKLAPACTTKCSRWVHEYSVRSSPGDGTFAPDGCPSPAADCAVLWCSVPLHYRLALWVDVYRALTPRRIRL
ncbi:ubiquinol-cytochrome c reductase hinge [Cyclospora cayetanensis]|uniref:Ubiquinol-cytochrome c reductase hinge n=1 Tax=Cyclospora cayetanensis TaxID=88456 RepID=A0A1D3D8G1_9EIME|nr:ubiquinol-cytochrome c reductase hinge [Cyclospora cayetanensis]